eukprot:TRINITY_DN9489_c0_g1_i1.p1 TRINITY_DN9489_c0_g1~~TRINITY_DN9489_c0_g1_i1.p1  ORF type:complete len:367 (+),score=43.67 TRINITY_DN9489_c0_g1_i1:12-1112(+)
MKAITFHGKCNVKVTQKDIPKIASGTDAIVSVKLAGLCGSDLHVYTEREPGLDIGTTMGHEFVGIVSEVGPDVKHIKIGDRVACPFSVSCSDCYYCKHALPSRCSKAAVFGWVNKGNGLDGAQAEFVRVPMADSNLFIIPAEVSYESALLLGDVFPTGYFCADMSGISELKRKYPDEPIVGVVIGCGPVGIMTILSALYLGVTKVYALDTVDERLALAKSFGAEVIDIKNQDPLNIIKEQTDGRGADCVMEAVGGQNALRTAFNIARPGAIISSIGVQTEQEFKGFSPIEGYDKNITYKNGRCPVKNYISHLLDLLRQDANATPKRFDISRIISHHVPLNDEEKVIEAYVNFNNRQKNCTKVVFTV